MKKEGARSEEARYHALEQLIEDMSAYLAQKLPWQSLADPVAIALRQRKTALLSPAPAVREVRR